MSSVIRPPAGLRLAILGFAIQAASAAALSAQTEVTVGSASIRLPAPPGFHEVSTLSPETRRVAESMTHPGNRLLAVLVSEADLGRLMAGSPALFERYMMVQTPRESGAVSASEFTDVVRAVKERHETAVASSAQRVNPQVGRAAGALSRESNVAVDLKIGEQRSLGIFTESDRTVGLATLARMQVAVDGEDRSYVLAGGTSMARVGGQLLFAYVYSNYSGPEDLAWVRATSIDWLSSIVSVNRNPAAGSRDSTSPSGLGEWAFNSAFDPRTVGVVVVVALGVARLVQKRRRQSV